MAYTIRSTFSNHTLHVERIARDAMPERCDDLAVFTTFYVVRNFDATGVVMLYLGKGHADAPREIVAWYPNGKMWTSFGTTLQSAIEGAQRDGWLYAR